MLRPCSPNGNGRRWDDPQLPPELVSPEDGRFDPEMSLQEEAREREIEEGLDLPDYSDS
jgi:hypothetical protein